MQNSHPSLVRAHAMGNLSVECSAREASFEEEGKMAELTHLQHRRYVTAVVLLLSVPGVKGDLATAVDAHDNVEDGECSVIGVLLWLVITVVGVAVIARGAATACSNIEIVVRAVLQSILETHQLQATFPTTTPLPKPSARVDDLEGALAVGSSDLPLFYGSDLNGSDARNLIVALCCMHDCSEKFVSLLLTLLGGVILPVGNSLNTVQGLQPVRINDGAKEFFADCEGKLHLKRRKCMRGGRVPLLQA